MLLFSLPPALVPYYQFLYGEDKWYRIWAMVLTFCLILCFPKGTRRLGAISFIGIAACAFIWHFINVAYEQYMPDEVPTDKSIVRHR